MHDHNQPHVSSGTESQYQEHKTVNKIDTSNTCNVDMESHKGLRGLCAIWVVLFHNSLFGSSGNIIILNGSVAMPIFFILSGFSLSVIYGSRVGDEDFNKYDFYRNRFARVYPVYLITLLFALPLEFTDFGIVKDVNEFGLIVWILKVVLNILVINMWVAPFPICSPINGPSWFVSVLWFQYMLFPYSVKYYRSIKRRILCISSHVVVTAFISTALFLVLNFVVATMNIISPGFLMFHTGVLCGFWCEEKTVEMKRNNNTDLMNDFQIKWSKYADVSTFLLLSWLCLSTVLHAVFGLENLKSNFIIQIYGTPLMIVMIISLTLDGGKSRIAKICRLDISKFLGRISMSLYLIHLPLLQYFCVIIQVIAPNLLELSDYDGMLDGGTMPWWGVFIMVPISLLAGYILERFVEVPCRNLLRSNKKTYYQVSTSSTAIGSQDQLGEKIVTSLHKPFLSGDDNACLSYER